MKSLIMNVGVLIFPKVEELDFVGPWEMLTMWKQVTEGPQTCLIVAQSRSAVVCSKGMSVNPDVSFDVCTGSFVLHAAGLLAGKKATTHWGSLAPLRELGDVEVIEDRFTQDGNIWCSAGVSAGIDLTLAFIASVAGDNIAGKVQFATEYYPSSKTYGNYRNDSRAPAYLKTSADTHI